MERKVIDVSKHQGIIDWSKVKGNVDGAIIRCGYGDDITSQDDSHFQHNVSECIKYGIPFGVYIYSYAKTMEQAKSEAAHVLRLVEPYKDKISYPVYLDLEESGTESGAVERALVFAEMIEAAGYTYGTYANQNWWQNYLKSGLDKYTKWVARYSDNKPEGISGTYDMWQYSSKGSVPGISGNVDMNICYRDFPSEIQNTAVVENAGTSNAAVPSYVVGNVYTTQVELKVRTGAGTNNRALTNAELSANAKQNDSDKDGAINKGTKVTCKAIQQVGHDVWMKIPSGWIAAYYQGEVFVK